MQKVYLIVLFRRLKRFTNVDIMCMCDDYITLNFAVNMIILFLFLNNTTATLEI